MSLPYAIMTALLEEEASGYDLARRFETTLGFFWQASHQQIYLELRRMADCGWVSATRVTQHGKPDKILYALTASGKQALDAWVGAASRRRDAKDDLYVKLYNIGHCDPAPVIREIRERRADHEKRLALYRRIRERHYADPAALPDTRKGVYLALAAGIRQEAMLLDWCDEALGLLDTVQSPG